MTKIVLRVEWIIRNSYLKGTLSHTLLTFLFFDFSLPDSATYGFGIVALDQKLFFVPNDEGSLGQTCNTEVFDMENPDTGWVIAAQMNYHRSQVKMYLFQEVGKPELGFPNHEFIQLWARTSARRAQVLPITV